jgi:carboxylesterase
LLEYLNESLDITFGLGEEVTVAGLSMGGVLAAWAAQNRSGIELAAPISPAFGSRLLPRRLTKTAVWLAQRLPNRFLFNNPKAGPASLLGGVYPRMATRPLAHIFGSLWLSGAGAPQPTCCPPGDPDQIRTTWRSITGRPICW